MTTRRQTVVKDPEAHLDYGLTWADWLVEGDTIAESTWAVPDGLQAGLERHTDTVAVIWLSGGAAGRRYELVNRIVTAQGRVDERTVVVKVENR